MKTNIIKLGAVIALTLSLTACGTQSVTTAPAAGNAKVETKAPVEKKVSDKDIVVPYVEQVIGEMETVGTAMQAIGTVGDAGTEEAHNTLSASQRAIERSIDKITNEPVPQVSSAVVKGKITKFRSSILTYADTAKQAIKYADEYSTTGDESKINIATDYMNKLPQLQEDFTNSGMELATSVK